MRLLDLFCGAGGCSVGYERAGFEVVGVDIEPQPNYPFEFIQGDALEVLADLVARADPIRDGHGLARPNWDPLYWGNPGPLFWTLEDFAAIHASPPCHAYSSLARMWNARADHPKLIAPTRELLHQAGLPYVIENVEQARCHLLEPVRICGSAIGLPLIRRHRLFECSFPIMVPPCSHGVAKKCFPALDAAGRRRGGKSGIVGVYGHGGDKRADLWPEAMGIDWMTRHELTQAIPPAYTEHIGHYLMAEINAKAKAA